MLNFQVAREFNQHAFARITIFASKSFFSLSKRERKRDGFLVVENATSGLFSYLGVRVKNFEIFPSYHTSQLLKKYYFVFVFFDVFFFSFSDEDDAVFIAFALE